VVKIVCGDDGDGELNPGGRPRGLILLLIRISALRSSCEYALVIVSPSCCWMNCLGVGEVWECP